MDFMSYSTDDLLYGCMLYLATYHPVEKTLYLTKANYAKNRKTLADLCGLTTRTLKNHLTALINKGLVDEEYVRCGDKDIESYVFPYDYDGTYEIVAKEMLWYIATTRNVNAVRVYIHLLSCYRWKQKESSGEYVFSNKDILRAIGYSEDNKLASAAVTNILNSFEREGVVRFRIQYQKAVNDCGVEYVYPQKILEFVAESEDELKPVAV